MDQLDQLATEALKEMVDNLSKHQHEDGSWKFCFEGGPMTDAFLLMTLKALNINDDELIKACVIRLRSLQTNNGSWKVYPNEKSGNLTATVQAYSALLVSGYYKKNDLIMKKAELFIRENGGLHKTHFMTKWMLAANGLFPWPNLFYIPMSFLLIPTFFPINFFQFSTYARIHFIPMMIVANNKFSLKHDQSPKLDHLFISIDRNNTWELNRHDRSVT